MRPPTAARSGEIAIEDAVSIVGESWRTGRRVRTKAPSMTPLANNVAFHVGVGFGGALIFVVDVLASARVTVWVRTLSVFQTHVPIS